jgi:hypothetical protein
LQVVEDQDKRLERARAFQDFGDGVHDGALPSSGGEAGRLRQRTTDRQRRER